MIDKSEWYQYADDSASYTEEDRMLAGLENDLAHDPHGFTKGASNWLNPSHTMPPTLLFDAMLREDSTITYMLCKADPDAVGLFDGQELFYAPNTPPLSLRVCVAAPYVVDRGLLSEYKTLTGANFRHLSPTELQRACEPRSKDLRECVMPADTVSTYLQFPTAGTDTIAGMDVLPPERKRRPLEMPYEPARTDPIRLGTAIGRMGDTINVTMGPRDLTTHMHVIGAPGSGKTTFLVNLANELTNRHIGFMTLSTHRDLTDRVLAGSHVTKRFRVLGVDHADGDHVAPLNPLGDCDDNLFALKTSELTDAFKEYIDPQHQGMFGERGASAFALVAQACRRLGCASIPMVTSIASRQNLCKVLAQAIRETDMSFSQRIDQELAGLSGSKASDLFSWMSSRFNVIHSSPLLMSILGSGRNTIDVVPSWTAPIPV